MFCFFNCSLWLCAALNAVVVVVVVFVPLRRFARSFGVFGVVQIPARDLIHLIEQAEPLTATPAAAATAAEAEAEPLAAWPGKYNSLELAPDRHGTDTWAAFADFTFRYINTSALKCARLLSYW